ncbi:MAG: alpha/beta hydrolase [Pseudomonadota bacterium]
MFPPAQRLDVGDVSLAVYEQGAGEPVILLHGFPELAFSWRFQLPALADAGFHAIAVDQRGYGNSDCPGNVAAYDIHQLTDDIDGLLNALGVEQSRFVAHDWGAIVLWHYALTRPERVTEMAVLNIPFYPRPPADPIDIFRHRYGDNFYIVNFQDSTDADTVFAANNRRFLDNMMRKNQLRREHFDALPAELRVISLLAVATRDKASGDALLSAAELDVFAEAFGQTGYTPGINWYRNMGRNWATTADIEQRIRPRTLFIGAQDDVVVPLDDIHAMGRCVDDLRIEMLAPCGHWTQQERPDDVNRLLVEFFSDR